MAVPYFGVAFAATGDLLPGGVPVALQPDGSISMSLGWGPDYELDDTAPGYKPVGRREMNSMFNGVTLAIGEIQFNGFPLYNPDAVPYPINATVRHSDLIWRSTVVNNSTVPGAVGTNWVPFGADYVLPQATTATLGGLKVATQPQVTAGTDDSTAVTPLKLATAITNISSSNGIAGSASNLMLTTTGSSAVVTISADAICLKDSSGKQKIINGVAVSPSVATSGANGLDTGVSVDRTWYSVWVVWNGTTAAGLLSLNATGPSMPAGYTHKARVGWVRTDATVNKFLLGGTQVGTRFQYKVGSGTNVPTLPIMAQGSVGSTSTPTWSPVSVASFVPPTAKRIIGVFCGGGGSGTQLIVAPNNSYGGYQSTTNPPPVLENGSQGSGISEMILESSNIYYASNSGSNAMIACFGWEDSL